MSENLNSWDLDQAIVSLFSVTRFALGFTTADKNSLNSNSDKINQFEKVLVSEKHHMQ